MDSKRKPVKHDMIAVRIDNAQGEVAYLTYLPRSAVKTMHGFVAAGDCGIPILAARSLDIEILRQEGFRFDHVPDAHGCRDATHGRLIMQRPSHWHTVVSDLERELA